MSCNWKNATEQQETAIREIERRRFQIRARYTIIICAICIAITCLIIGVVQSLKRRSVQQEILGYDPNEPPEYVETLYFFGNSQNSDWEETEEEFYEKQKKEIEQAHTEAVNQTKHAYDIYYICMILLESFLGAVIIYSFYMRMKDFSRKIQVCTGICMGKEKTVYRGRSYRSDEYYIDIRLEDGEIIKDIEVKGDAYDKIEYEEPVLMVKLEEGDSDIERVYPEKVFSEVTYEL